MNPFVRDALSFCVQDAILKLLQGDKELVSLDIALAIDGMMDAMTIQLGTDKRNIPSIEVMHPDWEEYGSIHISLKKIVDQFIQGYFYGDPLAYPEDTEHTKFIVDSFYKQAVRLKKAFDKYASQKYIPKE